ncbi:MAG: START domain-containing protein [archaeon]|nr:START domain-containing protein [archaeon]
MPYKPVSDSHVEMTYVVQPSHANTIGITFGGQIMSWMETAATISAMRHCRCQTALLSVDDLHFNQPTKVGDVVLIASAITRVFHTTMEVRVTVAAENLLTGDSVPCNTGLMVFIALDALKRPAVVAQVMPTTPDEIKQFRQARLRRDRRLDRRAQYFDFDYSSTGSSHAVAYAADAFALARVSQELFAEVEQMRSECAWETVSEEDGIRVAFSPVGYKSDITAVCCHVAVPAKTQSILRLLLDCHSRRSWDVLWVDGRVLEVLDDSHDILYEVNAHGPFLSRDFCFLRAWKIDPPLQNNNSSSTSLSSSTTTALSSAVTQDLEHTPCVLAYQSVDHPAAPCRKSYLRGELPPSGWTILPLSPSQSPKPGGPWSEITWKIPCNYTALSLIVGDLVGRGHVIRRIFQGIRRHFAAQNLSS